MSGPVPTSDSPSPSPFHEGERSVQERLGVRDEIEPWARQVIRPFLPEQHRAFYAALPFVVAAARDTAGRPWATILAGEPGFLTSPDPGRLQLGSGPSAGDALEGAFRTGSEVGLLGIDLATRRRNRVNGRIKQSADCGVELSLEVDQSFGNCPQYITERDWERTDAAHAPAPPQHFSALTHDITTSIRRADTLFIASGHAGDGRGAHYGMDASHRGGAPGFVKISGDRTLVIPDYAGNNHFNTLGNLVIDPLAGLVFVDFESGGMIQMTGRTSIDWDSEELSHFAGARRLIRFEIDEIVTREAALPLRWVTSEGAARPFRIAERIVESTDVTSFRLEPLDGHPVAPFRGGQHLPIELEIAGHATARTYSISNRPGASHYRLSIKRETRGRASRHLHDASPVGTTLSIRKPAGDFVIAPGKRPIVLLSGGIGVTPLLSMLHGLGAEQDSRRVWFVHGARNGRHHPLASEVRQAAAEHGDAEVRIAYSRPTEGDREELDYQRHGRIDTGWLAELLPDFDADFYLCGSLSFMTDLRIGLEAAGVPSDQIRFESFGPAA